MDGPTIDKSRNALRHSIKGVTVVGGGVSGAASVSQRACFVREVAVKDSGVCKLFQMETIYALLGKVGSADHAGVRYLGASLRPVGGVAHLEGHPACVGEGDAIRGELCFCSPRNL